MRIGLGSEDNCRLPNNDFNEETCENLLEFIVFFSCTIELTFRIKVLTSFQTYSQIDVLITLLVFFYNYRYKSLNVTCQCQTKSRLL